MTRMRRKVKVLAGLALVWVSGALYILHSNSHEVSFFSLVLISSLFLPTVPLSMRKAGGGEQDLEFANPVFNDQFAL